MKVLVVDDSMTMRKIVKNQLNSLNIDEILEANDGQEALDVLEENMPVDVVTLDINMPNMDGLSCLKKIRAEDKYSDVRVLMVTSESEKKTVVQALKAGANDYLVKPFKTPDFKEKLNIE